MTAYRPEFEAALRLFARVSEAMKARGFQAPVLVALRQAQERGGRDILAQRNRNRRL